MSERTWAEIDLDAAEHNIRNIRSITNPDAMVMATVKADAYGNGFYEMAKVFLENGADRLAIATLEEGIQLRKSGIDAETLILGTCMPDMIDGLIDYNITPNVYSYGLARQIDDAARLKRKRVKVHIKLDTGMGRIGYVVGDDNNENVIEEILKISELKNIEIEGIFSHFATSDETNREYTLLQYKRFMSVCGELEKRGLHIPIRHICNSAGIMMYPEMHLDMVRPGVILYGMYPSEDVDKSRLDLIPVMTLKSKITNIKEIGPGRGISYGREYITAAERTRVATVPLGYADGYLRANAHGGKMSVNGKNVPILGRICMDQCMIDVTNANNINVGDEVTVFGRSGVTIDDLAKWQHTINYEVSCCISRRVPRVYIRNGKKVKTLNYLLQSVNIMQH